ncbi:hypothetical protein FG386_001064 [Cryptosporidium ryanae]|uniref:uncharacterized protein n=1 Tax=Cryptosporidium ryanae TaxID=515981 RepID=UPI003519EFA9|nr:hypothetical protein FG386_001064 [Cryptosporidium ryanae]
MNWFEKLAYKLKKNEINEDSKVNGIIKEENFENSIEWIGKENKCLENDSIFNQIYELNGCYRCNLKIPGFGFGNYLCDIILMENELAVFHLINRNNLNIQCVIAPIAATAFAKTTVNDEDINNRVISRGEWVILPFNHIIEMRLIENNNLNIKTKSGINYIIGDNTECVEKMLKIYEHNIRNENSYVNSESDSLIRNNAKHEFKITKAETPVSNLDICTRSITEIPPYSNKYPCCIVSISNIKLAEIITSDLFYGKYILDPQETFNLIISEWNISNECKYTNMSNYDDNNNACDFILKSGSNRDIQYKKKINTGLVDIWISFKEKHQLLYPMDLSYIHLLMNVNFHIFEKEINIKLLLRILSLNEYQSQMDIECELENTSELPYLIRYQFENTTLNSIKSTVDRYISGIKNQMENAHNSIDNIDKSCINENLILEKITDCGTSCGIEFGVNNNGDNISCNNNMCCLVHLEKLFNKLVNNY